MALSDSYKLCRHLFICWVFGLFLQLTYSFNFDLQSPIVIHDTFDKVGSHFGASVSLVSPESAPGWIVIAAPKADVPLANYSKIKEPGLLWRCSLGLDQSNNCSILNIDPIGERDIKIGKVPKEVIHRDRKDYGMLGASMSAGHPNSSRFVVCSSRWANQKYKEHHLMNGLCYWLPKSELFSHNSSIFDFSHRLTPLVNASRQAYTLANANGQSLERRFDWAFGQAGFSVDLSVKNELLIGAPGILEWAGSVIQYSDYDPIKLNHPHRRFNQKDWTFAKVLVTRAQTGITRKLINYFDYFGYAVTSGRFFKLKSNQTQYASGAPRGNALGGKVLLFSFKEDISDTSPDDSLNFLVNPIIGESGNFFGSYFGSTLAALDVNGDGLDELLVGAPLYEVTVPVIGEFVNISDTSENMFTSGDEGCVFVYFSLGEDFSRDPQEICGESRTGARFGSAISLLGDINHDGFQDVAIGAPYEAENRGAVYIYIGSAKRLIFSQKIVPEGLDPTIRGFGYSLSGAVDIDQNSYGDLAIGAYESNHVVIYRSFPVVDVTANLSTFATALGTSTGIFTINACLTFRGHSLPQQLDIWMKLSVDTEFRKVRIVELLPDTRVLPENFSKGVIKFKGSYESDGTCYAFNVTTVGDLDLVTVPVTVRQEFWLDDELATETGPIFYELKKTDEGYPVLEGSQQNSRLSIGSTKPMLGPSTRSLIPKALSIPIKAICEEDGDPTCLAELSLNVTFRTPEGKVYTEGEAFVIGSSKSIFLQVELTNHRERANLPLTIEIAWESPPLVRSSRSDCKPKDTTQTQSLQIYTCTLSSPLTKNKKDHVELELDMTGLYAGSSPEILEFQLVANTSSLQVDETRLTVQLSLDDNSQLFLIGHISEGSYYENITAETVNFTQIYEVGLTGVSPISGVQIQVALPAALTILGKLVPFLRIREPITTYDGLKINCRSLNGSFYEEISYDHDDIGKVTGRVTRSVGKKKRTRIVQEPVRINCQTPGVECFWVECEAFEFKPSYRALLEFKLRLLTDAARMLLVEKDRDVLIIESMSRVSRLGSIPESKFAVSRTIIRAELPAEIKAWILIVAIGGGLILLTLIIICLTQCGFFRRMKFEEMAKLQATNVGGDFEFDNDLDIVDSLEYYDGSTVAESEFGFTFPRQQSLSVSGTVKTHGFTSDIYDEVEL